MMELWPFTNFHDLNLDWLISKWKKLEDNLDDIHASMDAAEGYADDAKGYMIDAKSAKNQAAIFAAQAGNKAGDAAASAASIEGVVDQVNTNTNSIENLIATAGDGTIPSELSDIRVGANNHTYTTAGAAVRGQVDDLADQLELLHETYYARFDPNDFANGGLNNDGTLTNQAFYVSSIVDFNFPYTCYIRCPDTNYNIRVIFKRDGVNYSDTGFITLLNYYAIPANTDFRICIRKNDGSFSQRDILEFAQQLERTTQLYWDVLDNTITANGKEATGWDLIIGGLVAGSGSSGGAYQSVSYRCMSFQYSTTTEALQVHIPAGYRMAYHLYDNTHMNIYDSGWLIGTAIIPANSIYRVQFSEVPEDTSILFDVASLYPLVYFEVSSVAQTRSRMENPVLLAPKARYAAHTGLRLNNEAENSIESFIAAGEAGFYACETDIRETSDGVLICMHDSTVDRTTNGSGSVDQMTYAQIRALTLTGSDYPVPSLSEFLAICNEYGMYPAPEIKSITSYNTLNDVLTSSGQYYRTIILASPYNANNIRNDVEDPLIMLVYQDDGTFNLTNAINTATGIPNTGIDVQNTLLNETVVQTAHAQDIPVWTFTPDSVAEKTRCWACGVDGITTNTI